MNRLRRVLELVFGRRTPDRESVARSKRHDAIETEAIDAHRAAVKALAERQRVIDATRGTVNALQRSRRV